MSPSQQVTLWINCHSSKDNLYILGFDQVPIQRGQQIPVSKIIITIIISGSSVPMYYVSCDSQDSTEQNYFSFAYSNVSFFMAVINFVHILPFC
jgi:hypothetical protein